MCRLVVVLVGLFVALCVQAQDYPARPLHVLHGFGAGGAPDVVLRRIAARLEQRLGRAVVVENRPGASGTIAAAQVAHAAPDGYTLLFGVAANIGVAPATERHPSYDPRIAFTPIVEVSRGPYLWLVRADAPVHTMGDFVAWAKQRPGALNYASPGNASVHHLATEMLARAAGIELVHVPYNTGLYAALLGGQVQAMFESMPGPAPYLAAGKLRALAVTGPHRLRALPDVPTLAEQGIAGIDANSWWGFVGPRGLPAKVVARLNREIRAILAEPQMRATLDQMSIEASPGTPEAFGRYIAAEYERWRSEAERLGELRD